MMYSDTDDYYNERGWDCSYCNKQFTTQGQVLFHENTWCKIEHERRKQKLEEYKKMKQKKEKKKDN